MNQYVYALTTNGHDIFVNMTRVSMMSLRLNNPGAKIIVVCDAISKLALDQFRHPILKECNSIINIPTPQGSAGFRNRYVKTSLRQHLSGPFLYLDADTIIREDLSELFEITTSFSAAPNHNGSGNPTEIPTIEKDFFTSLKWPLPRKYYVNGGVLFFNDDPDVHHFCNLWHEKWLVSSEKTGKHYDQPSLNSAINDSQINFAWLEHRFNAQVHARPHTAWGAAIWHIYLSEPHSSPKTILNKALAQLRENSLVSSDEIIKPFRKSHPWIVKNPIDLLAVQSLKLQSNILDGNRWERLCLADQYSEVFQQIKQQTELNFNKKLYSLRALASKVKNFLKKSNIFVN